MCYKSLNKLLKNTDYIRAWKGYKILVLYSRSDYTVVASFVGKT